MNLTAKIHICRKNPTRAAMQKSNAHRKAMQRFRLARTRAIDEEKQKKTQTEAPTNKKALNGRKKKPSICVLVENI